MASIIGDVAVRVLADTAAFQSGVEKGVTGSLKKVGRLASGLFAGFGAVSLFKDTIAEAQEATKVMAQTQAVIKSTGGVANISAASIGALANQLSLVSGVDDELIQQGENVLATFTNIRDIEGKNNDIFTQATKATLDLSAALHTDLQSSVIQVGKALNDPIKGVTALRRVGVSFTAAQLKQIKALQATGDLLGAQKIILGELNREFGGTAAAVATPLDKLKVAMKNVEETLGTALMPTLNKFADILIKLSPILPTLIPIILGVVAAIKLWSIAQAVINLLLFANPIGLVIIALGLLVIGIVGTIKQFQGVRDVLGAVWDVFKTVFNWIKHNWPLLLAILIGPFGIAVKFIIDHWNGILTFFKEFPGKVARFFEGLPQRIVNVFSGLMRAMFDIGHNLLQSLINGAGSILTDSSWGHFWEGVGASISDFVSSALGIGSPSKVFMGFGRNIAEGLVVGMQQGAHRVQRAAGGLTGSLLPAGSIDLRRGLPAPAAAASAQGLEPTSIVQNFTTQARDERVLANEIAFRFEEMSRR